MVFLTICNLEFTNRANIEAVMATINTFANVVLCINLYECMYESVVRTSRLYPSLKKAIHHLRV